MTYRILRQDASCERWMALVVKNVPLGSLLTGSPLEQPIEEPVRVMLAAGRTRPSDFLDLPCFVVSSAMRAALEGAGVDNVEYFRAELHWGLSGSVIRGYCLANVIGTLACIDHGQSNFEGATSDYAGRLLSFEIDLERTYGLGMFRLAEDRRLIVVHERVRSALQVAKLTGLVFQEPRDYDGQPVHGGGRPES
jgi:hypothetical protein